MSEQPKPPLSVWLGDNVLSPHVGGGEQEQRGTYSTNSKTPYHNGPYVHLPQFLDQFLEMVERRMEDNQDCCECPYCWRDAARWVRHQMEEGK